MWLLIAGMLVGYWWLIRRLAPLYAPAGARPVTRRQSAAFAIAVVTLWAVSDWPLHDLAEEVFLWVHMVEHVTLAFVVVPLLLVGVPDWLWQALLKPTIPVLRRITHPMIGLFGFGAVFAVTHWPPVIAFQVGSEIVHLVAHLVLVTAAFLMFWPVLSPLPAVPRLPPFRRMGYLFLQTLPATIPASFLTFASTNIYPDYASGPVLWGIDPVTDQQLAGLVMKLGAGLILWSIITVVFFRWAAAERRLDDGPALASGRTQ